MSEENLAPSVMSHALNLIMYLDPEHRDEVFKHLANLRQKFGEQFASDVFKKAQEMKQAQKEISH